ncbi:holin [Mobiluncus curtisii]|uniref:Holin n=1 Tax=Mobiluncus curtisii ATCC 51333 TaxID=887326 RepID=E6M114_9ACTO|nr:holin [Mobiluncus curtisii]EFU79644.1 hypothetical protein HMPREF0388_1747 [Mobiluncus curtisii ATCC 51333]
MASYITDKTFWVGVLERALKTFAQSLIASFGVGVTLLNADWVGVLAVAGTATFLSVLTSLAAPSPVRAPYLPDTSEPPDAPPVV